MSKSTHYLKNIKIPTSETPLQSTIAIILAFSPLSGGKNPEWGKQLTAKVLSATMASLQRACFERVVVVGYDEKNADLADQTFRLLGNVDDLEQPTPGKLGLIEIGYVNATDEDVNSSVYEKANIPKGSISGLKNALRTGPSE